MFRRRISLQNLSVHSKVTMLLDLDSQLHSRESSFIQQVQRWKNDPVRYVAPVSDVEFVPADKEHIESELLRVNVAAQEMSANQSDVIRL